jgi:hypothetical protein
MAFFDFLGDAFQGIGNIGADTDKFMKREMPFDSGWGAPAALIAAVAAPEVLPMLGEAGAGSTGALDVAGTAGGSGGFMDSLGSMFGGGNSGGFGIGQGANYSNLANTSGGSFSNLNSLASPSGSEFGLNFGSPSSIASSNSSIGLSNLSPTGGSGFSDFLNQAMKNQQHTSQQNQGVYQNASKPMDVVRQPAFLGNTAPVNVQDKQTDLAALIKALRG